MNKFLSLAAAGSLFAAPAAFAVNAQTHHCDMNGTEVAKTHKDCTKSGGKWKSGAPTMGAAKGSTPVSPSTDTANAGKASPAPAYPDPSRQPSTNKAIPANTPPTPNGNNTMTPPPGDRTPGN